MDSNKITAKVILEMLGAPKEYVETTLKNYVDSLKKQGLDVKTEVYVDAKEQGKLFSAFVELVASWGSTLELLDFCFDSMPSSIEILEPTNFVLNGKAFENFLNDLQARLHEADMIVKGVRAQSSILDGNATAVFYNFISHLVSQEPRTVPELSSLVGVSEKHLRPFLDKLIEQKRIVLNGDKYGFSRAEKQA